MSLCHIRSLAKNQNSLRPIAPVLQGSGSESKESASRDLLERAYNDFTGDGVHLASRRSHAEIRCALLRIAASARAVQGIDQNVRLNRALWLLADGMRKLEA